MCLFFACDAQPLANLTLPLSVLGRAANATVMGAVNLTVRGAPWTTDVVTIPLASGSVSRTRGDLVAGDGTLVARLVTPICIATNLGAFATIRANGAIEFAVGEGCSDGVDNDGAGFTDAPSDPGCASLADPSERSDSLVCDDGRDADGDGAVDASDAGCTDPSDTNERGDAACDDALDQDGDGLVSFPADPGCDDVADADETGASACDDGIDGDADGLADASDPGCIGPLDEHEGADVAACGNGQDDDGDGAIDAADTPRAATPRIPKSSCSSTTARCTRSAVPAAWRASRYA